MGGGGGIGGTLGTVAGGVGGFMLGGPAGAAVGAGLGNSLLGGGPKQVDTPNYTGAAQQTSASDLAANRVNKVNPYGSINYQQTGTDSYGNPTWTQTQSLNPQLQSAITSNLGQLGQQFQAPQFQGQDMAAMNYFGSRLNQQQFDPNSMQDLPQFNVNTQIDRSQLPTYGINPGQAYEQAIMSRLQPQIAREQSDLDAKLANQGIMEGSEAYNRAIQNQQQNVNDRLTSAIVGGMDVGLRANQQEYGQQANQIGLNLTGNEQNFGQVFRGNAQGMDANSLAYQQQLANQELGMRAQNQGFNQAIAQAMLPYQQGAMLQGLASPSTFAGVPSAAGTNYLGATQMTNAADVANANAQNAYNNSLQNGLFSLGGAALMSGGKGMSNVFGSRSTPANVYDYSKPYGG